MKPWLSILIPSNRPEALDAFMQSAMYNSQTYNNIQFVILRDGPFDSVVYEENIVNITKVPRKPLSISVLQEECFKYAQADWIMLGNDDVIIETKAWDVIIQSAIKMHDDGIALIWPDDNMLQEKLSCFPIFHRKVFELIYPLPYQRYKVDDTIFNAFPDERKIYLSSLKFTHLNDKGEVGYPLGDGRIYPTIPEVGMHDENEWKSEIQISKRHFIRKRIREWIGKSLETSILIGVSTMEIARRADFYDFFYQMQKPNNTRYIAAHGQSPARARNLIFQEALDKDCTHVFLLDDDTAYRPDILMKLLAHDKDVICGLQLMRAFPHMPIIFDYFDERGHARWLRLTDGESGLVPIVAAGLGCVLIKTSVLENMERPWVRLGELESDNWCDDIGFWLRMHKQNKEKISMFCDLDTPVGHNVNLTIWPNRIDNVWYTTYESGGPGQAHVLQEKRIINDTDRTNKDLEPAVA